MKIIHVLKIMLPCLKQSKSKEEILQADNVNLKEAVEQAERKSMNKSLALARASHDMRNVLYSNIELIRFCQAQTTSSEMQTNLAQINDYTMDLIDLLNTILDTSKVESGKMHLDQAEFNVSQIIEKSVDIFNILGEKKGLEIIWDPCDFSIFKLVKVIGDKQRFKQILDNLLGNAVKFTSEGKVVVRAWASEPKLKILNISSDYGCSIPHMLWCLSRRLFRQLRKKISQQDALHLQKDPNSIELTFEVDDTGIGIPSEKRASVFENYVQVKEDSPEGTGLGLGIVQSFVRLMGGEISILDKEPGEKGTCFKFNIFLRSGEVALQSTSRHEETNQSAVGEPFMMEELHSVNLHSLLFVQGKETKRILQAWIKSLGIKVWTACLPEHISPTLEKIKHSINFSTKSDSALLCKTFSLKAGHQPGAEWCSELPLKILVIIDLSNGNLPEILSTLTDFIERNTHLCFKIACIVDLKVTEEDLSKFRALRCDLTLRKPIHGSRLHELFKLIQELEKADDLYLDRAATPMANPPIEEKSVKLCEITEDDSTRIEDEKLLSGKHVLLVDDNAIMRRLGSAILSQLGANVEVAEDGSKALYLVKKTLQARGKHSDYSFNYHAIFMDCQMPVVDGYEAARQIRKEESQYGIHIPIIALTADESNEVVQKVLDAGMDFHLEKPLNKSKVEKAFNHVCS